MGERFLLVGTREFYRALSGASLELLGKFFFYILVFEQKCMSGMGMNDCEWFVNDVDLEWCAWVHIGGEAQTMGWIWLNRHMGGLFVRSLCHERASEQASDQMCRFGCVHHIGHIEIYEIERKMSASYMGSRCMLLASRGRDWETRPTRIIVRNLCYFCE